MPIKLRRADSEKIQLVSAKQLTGRSGTGPEKKPALHLDNGRPLFDQHAGVADRRILQL
jgi:hypothetical protein